LLSLQGKLSELAVLKNLKLYEACKDQGTPQRNEGNYQDISSRMRLGPALHHYSMPSQLQPIA
jgi:hypothetical protein